MYKDKGFSINCPVSLYLVDFRVRLDSKPIFTQVLYIKIRIKGIYYGHT